MATTLSTLQGCGSGCNCYRLTERLYAQPAATDYAEGVNLTRLIPETQPPKVDDLRAARRLGRVRQRARIADHNRRLLLGVDEQAEEAPAGVVGDAGPEVARPELRRVGGLQVAPVGRRAIAAHPALYGVCVRRRCVRL